MSEIRSTDDIPLYNGIATYRDSMTGDIILQQAIPDIRRAQADDEEIELLTGITNGTTPTLPPPSLELPPPDPIVSDVPSFTNDPAVLARQRSWVNRYRGVIKELEGSGAINFTKEGIVGTRIYLVPFVLPDRYTYYDFVQALLGWTYVDAANNTVAIPPDVFSREMNWLICQEASVEPRMLAGNEEAHDNRVPTWPTLREMAANGCMFPNYNALWTAFPNGTVEPMSSGPQPLLPRAMHKHVAITAKYAPFDTEETISISGKTLSVPGGAYAFTSPDDPTATVPAANARETVPYDVQIPFPFEERSIQKRQVWNPNFAQIRGLMGKVNANWFMGYPPRTILVMGCEAHRTYAPNGTRTWNLNFKLLFNPKEHVRIYNRKTTRYEYIRSVQTGEFLFQETDINVIHLWV